MINTDLKNFIKEHQHLIERNDFNQLYLLWQRSRQGKTTWLTLLLYSANINPLLYMDVIPGNFLFGADPLGTENLLSPIPQIFTDNKTFTIPQGIETILDDAFSYFQDVKCIRIPKSVNTILGTAFSHMPDLEYIEYEGTKEDWNNLIYKDEELWNLNSKNLSIIKCSDGDIYL